MLLAEPPVSLTFDQIISQAEQRIHYMHVCLCNDLTSGIDFWMGTDLHSDWRHVPGKLICNLYEDPILVTGGPGYKTGRSRKIIEHLKASRRLILRSVKSEQKDPIASASDRAYALKNLSELNCIASVYLNQARDRCDDLVLINLIDHLLELYSEALKAKQFQGKFHALRTAVCLRAIFEHHSDVRVTTGKDENLNPTGRFCRCLEQVFDKLGIEAGFYHYAGEAANLSEDADLLVEARHFLNEMDSDRNK